MKVTWATDERACVAAGRRKSRCFGLLRRGGKGYAAITPNAKTATLRSIIGAKLRPDSFNGIQQENFYGFLKECEWRLNGGNHPQFLRQLKYGYKHTKH